MDILKTAPAVFAVGTNYQIMAAVTRPSLFWVQVGKETYYDAANGIMCSQSDLHRVTLPMQVLDAAKAYTVYVRPLIERKPYFTTTEPPIRETYAFRPVPMTGARCYHIADAHNRVAEPIAAAKVYGPIDFLVLNGDVIDHSGDPSKFDNIYQIAAQITGGEIPTVFSRGNHDLRGNFAEKFATYTPNDGGNTYYTFRLGSIWGLVMDCGEDKPDDHAEYGFTVACHDFRVRQTAFLRQVIAAREYAALSVKTRLVIVHNPFTQRLSAPFDIEDEIFTMWAQCIRENIRPDAYLCGHLHEIGIHPDGGAWDQRGQGCPVIIGALPEKDGFVGCGIAFDEQTMQVDFTDNKGVTRDTAVLQKQGR